MKTILSSRRHRYLVKVCVFLITAALIAGMAGCVERPPDKFAGGSGTASDPYQIANWHHLDNVRSYLGAHFILVNDLDSTTAGYEELASPTANEGSGWQPIGTEEDDLFTGTFDGQGYEIRDLFINRPDESYVGLFSCVEEGGVIKDIGVVNADVTGDYEYVGGLVGVNHGTVSNSYSTGSVTGESLVGGLMGENAGNVIHSYSTGSVTGSWKVGGLVGVNHGTVSNSYATGSVTGSWKVGGLVGQNGKYQHEGTVSNSYATGSVTGESLVGGLVGAQSYAILSNSYSTGSVTGSSEVGGLVGWNYENTLSNSYSSGNVTGDQCVGGLVGYNEGLCTVSNSYSTGSVTGGEYVGGLVGLNYESTVSDSYATGNINGDSLVGGLVGRTRGTVSSSYSTGSVTGESHVGGLVGYNEHWCTVSNSYSTGIVIGNEDVGGLVGENDGSVDNSFWDIQTSGQSTSDGGTGKNTTEMQDIATFSGAGWNITAVANPGIRNPSYIWNIVDSTTYPFLSWEAF